MLYHSIITDIRPSVSQKRERNFRSICFYNPPFNFRAILLGTLRHVVQNHRLSRNNPGLRRYLCSDYFRRKETNPAEKSQSFTFLSSDSDIKKLAQMLFRKVRKYKIQQNMLSTSLKVKKVTISLSDLVLRRLKGFI